MWTWVAFFAGVGAALLWMGRHQPFPEHGMRFGWVMLAIAGTLAIATQSPRETAELVPAYLAAGFGGIGVVLGTRTMSVTRRDVLVAPFAGLLLTVGTISLLADGWMDYDRAEQIFGFIIATALILLEMFLFWKGLIVGVRGITWSQAALRQMERGLLEGPRGAIAMFERSWNMEEEWLNAMSHAALMRIHNARGEAKAADHHRQRLARLGGIQTVDEAWLSAIDSALTHLGMTIGENE